MAATVRDRVRFGGQSVAATLVLLLAAAAPAAAANASTAVSAGPAAADASTAPSGAAAGSGEVSVVRTKFGVPHITADSFRGVGYGYGRAIAEDAICTLAETYVTVRAERSRWFGPAATYVVGGNGTTVTNLSSDFVFQRYIDRGTVERLAAEPPPSGPRPEVAEGLQGYVDGYNDWLASVGGSAGVPDPSCRGKAWVKPITLLDAYRRVHQLAILASTGAALEGIATAQPPGVAAAAARATAATPSGAAPQATRLGAGGPLTSAASPTGLLRALAPGAVDEALSGLGSNAYAIGSEASRTGHGLLYGNPHFPWQGSERFYQAHLTVPGRADVTGGSLLGIPLIMIGTTRGMAWSHTVSTARRFVPYELKLARGNPAAYVQDGKTIAMRAEPVTVTVREADGSLGTRTRTLYSSEHGSITTQVTGLPIFPWSRATAFALHDGNAENFGRLANSFLGLNEAQSVDDVDAALRRHQGIPWVNTIAADSAGNAYYADIGNVPGIPNSKYQRCLTLFGRLTDGLQRLPVLDGSRRACQPGTDPDSAAPGILGASRMPSLRRRDHTSNMNDSYWLANPKQPLRGYPRIIGDERTQRSLRTRIGLRQLEQRIDGSDGLPGKNFDLDNLREVAFGNRVYSAELWRDELVRGCKSRPCQVLRAWNLRSELDAPGAVLWKRFVTRLSSTSPIPLPGPWNPYRGRFNANDPVNTPAGLQARSPIVQWALTKAASDLNHAGLPLDATLRRAHTVTRGGETIPIHGGTHGEGVFNVITPLWDKRRGYTDVVSGNSFIQAVDLRPGCPRVRTLLTYGQSTNPDSPRSIEQTRAYSAKQWNDLPFCDRDPASEAISIERWPVPGS